MRLHEYQTKQIISKYGIEIPRGEIAVNSNAVKQIAEEIGSEVVIKAQVLVGGRGKAGGIRLAKSPEEAHELATEIISMVIEGFPVKKVLVEEAINFDDELYVGVATDRNCSLPVMIGSGQGGIDIEETVLSSTEKVFRVHIDPLLGLREYQIRSLALSIDLPREYWNTFSKIANGIWNIYLDHDALLVEINPLVITSDRRLLALDGKMNIDDSALFRHPELADLQDLDKGKPAEIEAKKHGLSYIKMEGNIGCLVNGAGLAMATMDILEFFGGKASNFLDIGGGASAEEITFALRIIISDPNVEAILINIFGGITRCDEVAKGILTTLREIKPIFPVVVRLAGTNAKEGLAILNEEKIETAKSLVAAVKRAVELTKGAAK
ncbi:MAG TPA: ADP-forming succinate--CoA ligase subunit beta [Anaerolineae bacterium]|nr:ADP-forming succinate--CoA ligase subunit beta [Anaerolineae bacterium]